MTDKAQALMGSAEIAELLEVSRQRVQQLIGKPGFPAPVADLAMGKVWATTAVRAWGVETHRIEPDCARCGRQAPPPTSAEFSDWEALGDGSGVVCPECTTGEERQAMDEAFADGAAEATSRGQAES
jgi:hypothetical protein